MFPGAGDQKDLGKYLAMGQAGLEMVAPIALGWLIDSYFGITPVAIIAGAVIGFVGGLAHLIHMASQQARPKPTARNSASEQPDRRGTV